LICIFDTISIPDRIGYASPHQTPEKLGAVQYLWQRFPGKTNADHWISFTTSWLMHEES
jgi:hypothetical protein